jgi:hypothetical protein
MLKLRALAGGVYLLKALGRGPQIAQRDISGYLGEHVGV